MKHQFYFLNLLNCRQQVCPQLVALLGTPTCDGTQSSSTSNRFDKLDTTGRGNHSMGGQDQIIFSTPDVARSVYV
jgi:hypothetical protein